MNRPFALLLALVTALALVHPDDADARRMGGGRSFGAQRSFTPAPPASAPAGGAATNPVMPARPGAATNPVMPAQPGAAASRPAAGATPGATAPQRGFSRWLGPIAGIAAGLGLAALFSHLGLSEGFGSLLLLLLVVGGGFMLVRALFRRGASSPAPMRYAPQAASAGAGEANDRIEPTVSGMEPAWGGSRGATADAPSRFPPGFEPAPFAAEAKRQFERLQEAYDRGDRRMLADVLTPRMQEEIGREIDERGAHLPTEVVALDAEVLEVTTEGNEHWASVRFKGLTREDGKAAAEPFDEVWNLVKPVNGSVGWRLAGIQQYA
jgi:predicted lipid-binding transport protein (Tim44 family)